MKQIKYFLVPDAKLEPRILDLYITRNIKVKLEEKLKPFIKPLTLT